MIRTDYLEKLKDAFQTVGQYHVSMTSSGFRDVAAKRL